MKHIFSALFLLFCLCLSSVSLAQETVTIPALLGFRHTGRAHAGGFLDVTVLNAPDSTIFFAGKDITTIFPNGKSFKISMFIPQETRPGSKYEFKGIFEYKICGTKVTQKFHAEAYVLPSLETWGKKNETLAPVITYPDGELIAQCNKDFLITFPGMEILDFQVQQVRSTGNLFKVDNRRCVSPNEYRLMAVTNDGQQYYAGGERFNFWVLTPYGLYVGDVNVQVKQDQHVDVSIVNIHKFWYVGEKNPKILVRWVSEANCPDIPLTVKVGEH